MERREYETQIDYLNEEQRSVDAMKLAWEEERMKLVSQHGGQVRI